MITFMDVCVALADTAMLGIGLWFLAGRKKMLCGGKSRKAKPPRV